MSDRTVGYLLSGRLLIVFTRPWHTDSPGDRYGGGDSGGECGVPATRLFPTTRAAKDSAWSATTVGRVREILLTTSYFAIYLKRFEARWMGPGRDCSPHHKLPFIFKDQGSKCVG